jgi:hypothetical protein
MNITEAVEYIVIHTDSGDYVVPINDGLIDDDDDDEDFDLDVLEGFGL